VAADHGRTRASLGALVVVLLLALLFWWSDQQTGDDTARAGGDAASQAASPGPAADDVPAADPVSGLPVVEVEDLPGEAAEVLADIDRGGPYEYDRDGTTFGNYEGILPDGPRGHYREYTVGTPGLTHRGARRIVVGGGTSFYWTDDHYESFSRIWR